MNQSLNTWGLDSQFLSFRKLLIEQLKTVRVTTNEMCYEFYLSERSIQRVEIVGHVVSKSVKSKKVILFLDDGTGVMQCVKFYDETDYEKAIPFTDIKLGDVVSIRGKIVVFDRSIVVHAVGVEVLTDPNLEVLHWVAAMCAYKKIYSQPFYYGGSRPWVEFNPFAACTCKNITPCKLLLRDDLLYCPCIHLMYCTGSSSSFTQIGGGGTPLAADALAPISRLFGTFLLHHLILLQREHKQNCRNLYLQGQQEGEYGGGHATASSHQHVHSTDKTMSDLLSSGVVLARAASIIAYYNLRIRSLSRGSLCSADGGAISTSGSPTHGGEVELVRFCSREWCTDASSVCPRCHYLHLHENNSPSSALVADPALLERPLGSIQVMACARELISNTLNCMQRHGLICVVNSTANLRASGKDALSRRLTLSVNTTSDIILPALLKIQREARISCKQGSGRIPASEMDAHVINAGVSLLCTNALTSDSGAPIPKPSTSGGAEVNTNCSTTNTNILPWRVNLCWRNYKRKKLLL